MEPKKPDDRPESPKKKIRPSSTTNSEVSHSGGQSSTDSVGTSNANSIMNGYGLAPTRRGRDAEAACSSSETTNSNRSAEILTTPRQPENVNSIQEEVVSSSENSVNRRPPVHNDGNADSLSNSEAESKEL